MGNTQEDILSTLANRLIRLDKQISEKEKTNFAEQANGHNISHVVKELLNAYDPDTISNLQLAISNENPGASPANTHSPFTIHDSSKTLSLFSTIPNSATSSLMFVKNTTR